jgi:hypothetical protein
MSLQPSSPFGDESRALVSVVVPAFNAASTLDATLRSVRAQTHAALEIIVVDDGSTDATRRIAEAHAAQDARVRVLATQNGGVAAARNAGIAVARGAFVAPIDADDLWRPEKIALQLEAMARGGPRMGYVYTAWRKIDMQGRVLFTGSFANFRGPVFLRSLLYNHVGNGSALLIRREALADAGGYDPTLRARGVEGAEDRLLQSLISRRWTVGAVPLALTGYRETPNAMSSDQMRMLRSQILLLDILKERVPETPRWALDIARAQFVIRVAILSGKRGDLGAAASQALQALRLSPVMVGSVLGGMAFRWLRGRGAGGGSPAAAGVGFCEVDPGAGLHPLSRLPVGWISRLFARREEAFFRKAAAPDAAAEARPAAANT